MQDQLEQFNELKPELTNQQQMLSNAFCRLSQERKHNQGVPEPIKDRNIHYWQSINGSCHYPRDLFIMGIHSIDNEYMIKQCEEIRRKANKGK